MLVKFDTARSGCSSTAADALGSIYTAHPDKNGEVWAGELHTGRYLRFNPKTEQWTEYVLPGALRFDRESWIDNSTDPVTVWYTDHDGWIARISRWIRSLAVIDGSQVKLMGRTNVANIGNRHGSCCRTRPGTNPSVQLMGEEEGDDVRSVQGQDAS